MIRLNLESFVLEGPPREAAAFLRETSYTLTNQEMADLTGVSIRTVENWRREPTFPLRGRPVPLLAFLRFMVEYAQSCPRKIPQVPSN